jgi:hypothetical protein
MSYVQLEEKDARAAWKDGTPSDRTLLERLYPDLFKKDIVDRIQTLDDIYSIVFLDREERKRLWDGMRIYPHLIHFHQACLIAEAYNQGWVPDWNKSGEYKYYPYWDLSGSGFRLGGVNYFCSCSNVGSRLVFRETRFVEDAVKKFPDVYKGFLTFNGK